MATDPSIAEQIADAFQQQLKNAPGAGGSSRQMPFGYGSSTDEKKRAAEASKKRRLQLEAQGRVFSGSPDSYATNAGAPYTSNIGDKTGPGQIGGSGVPKKVLYYAGDEYKPGNVPGNIIDLQQQLIMAGLLDEGKVHMGAWDDVSASAYRKVLTLANQYGTSAQDVLQGLVQNPSLDSLTGGKQAPVITLTNPTELRESFRQTFNDRVGHDPSPAAMDAFVDQYHNEEASAQRAYNDGAPGSTVTKEASAAGRAQEDIDKQYAAEQQAYQTVKRENDFFSMLGPIGGS